MLSYKMKISEDQFRQRAITILENMARERKGWRGFFRRWSISHEPLRNDAANLLNDLGVPETITELNTGRLGNE